MKWNIGIGFSPLMQKSLGSWSSYWKTLSTFWSDGTVDDGKLKDVLGRTDLEPSLVESNCIQIAINDTIVFDDLSGWSLVSNLGTAVVEISGDTIICTTGGTLYKLILSDGTSQHVYPLAEGANTTAFDVSENPQNGIITCAELVWATQDEYHFNVNGSNYINYIDTFKQETFVDGGSGWPAGWARTHSGCAYTTINNVCRVLVPEAGIANYYRFSLFKNAILESGKTYRVTMRLRGSKHTTGRYLAGTAYTNIYISTAWQVITANVTANGADFAIYGNIIIANVGDWFEFDYCYIEENLANSYYAPRAFLSGNDVFGNAIAEPVGVFNKCETKLQFPDNVIYDNIENPVNLEFFKDRFGTTEKYSYDDLCSDYRNLGRIFTDKDGNTLTRFIIVDPANYTRNQFISFIKYIDRNDYAYRKITNGCLIFYPLSPSNWETDYPYFSDLGLTYNKIIPNDLTTITEATALKYLALTRAGHHLYRQIESADYGGRFNTAIEELLEDEAEMFADEIASGDLILTTNPDGGNAAYIKFTVPDFSTLGELVATTKQNASAILDNADLIGYAPLLWIPSGQSGVPSEFEEVPLSIATGGRLAFRGWAADLYFSATFTNTDSINVYIIRDGEKYYKLFSPIGYKCLLIHHRNVAERYFLDTYGIKLKVSGMLETHPYEMIFAGVASDGAYNAGMIFGSSGNTFRNGYLKGECNMFIDYNDLSKWCCYFGHNLWRTDGLSTILDTRLPAIAANKEIRESDMDGWGTINQTLYDQVIAKCNELGIMFLGPIDFIKNMQFGDYDGDDFF